MITAFLVIFSGISCFLSGQIYFESGLFHGISLFRLWLEPGVQGVMRKNNLEQLWKALTTPYPSLMFLFKHQKCFTVAQHRIYFLTSGRSHFDCISSSRFGWQGLVVRAVMQAAKQTSAQSEGFRRRREKRAPFKGCVFFPLGATSNLEKRKKAKGQGRAFPVQTHLV